MKLYIFNSATEGGLVRSTAARGRRVFEAVISNAVGAYGEIILVETLMRKHFTGRRGVLDN